MTDGLKKIFFFMRAYNDLDIQLSLITEFAADKRFDVHVMFYPCDGFITHPRIHEAVDFMQETYGVKIGSVLEDPACPLWLRVLYRTKDWAFNMRQNPLVRGFYPFARLFQALDVGLAKVLKPVFLGKTPNWVQAMAQNWNPDIVFTDEALFQPGRAAVIDQAVLGLIEKGAVSYAILTGHRVYFDVYPSGKKEGGVYRPSKAKRFFVPSDLNKQICSVLYPKEKIIVGGNLRMDSGWIKRIHSEILPDAPNLPDAPVKVVLMLSKMNYGVEANLMKETIRRLGAMEGVALAIKPHTRGMKFDFMPKSEIGHAVIADKIPSSQLIAWGDIVLMTGSSIVFHSMQCGKVSGFLKYCQDLETIFDDGKSCEVFESLEGLTTYVQNAVEKGIPQPSPEVEKARAHFTTHEIHGDVKDGLTARNYKHIILEDLGMEEADTPTLRKKAKA